MSSCLLRDQSFLRIFLLKEEEKREKLELTQRERIRQSS